MAQTEELRDILGSVFYRVKVGWLAESVGADGLEPVVTKVQRFESLRRQTGLGRGAGP